MAVFRAEMLYTPECPHAERACALLRRILAEEGFDVPVERVPVLDLDDAAALGFPGSPTIRLGGVDVEPVAGDVGLACRLYRRADGTVDTVPADEAIHAAVRAAIERRVRSAPSSVNGRRAGRGRPP